MDLNMRGGLAGIAEEIEQKREKSTEIVEKIEREVEVKEKKENSGKRRDYERGNESLPRGSRGKEIIKEIRRDEIEDRRAMSETTRGREEREERRTIMRKEFSGRLGRK